MQRKRSKNVPVSCRNLFAVNSSAEQAAMLNQVVLQHFYRHGQLEIAETLAREANLNECLKDSKQPFQVRTPSLSTLMFYYDLTRLLVLSLLIRVQFISNTCVPCVCSSIS